MYNICMRIKDKACTIIQTTLNELLRANYLHTKQLLNELNYAS